jgi:hypothetical protein
MPDAPELADRRADAPSSVVMADKSDERASDRLEVVVGPAKGRQKVGWGLVRVMCWLFDGSDGGGWMQRVEVRDRRTGHVMFADTSGIEAQRTLCGATSIA